MIQIGKIDMYVRGGPEIPDEAFPGETAGQFDSLLNALVIMPAATAAEGESPVPNDSDWTGFANDSTRTWKLQTSDQRGLEPGFDLSVDYNPEQPVDLNELPPVNGETTPDQATDHVPPVLGAPEPTAPIKGFPQIMQRLDIQGRERHFNPTVDGKPVEIDQKVDPQKVPLPGDTPPIIILPNNPKGYHIRPPIRVPGNPIEEIAKLRIATPNDVKTDAPRLVDTPDESPIIALESGTETGESKSDAGSGDVHIGLAKEVRLDPGKISDAIFERFAVDAEIAIHESDFEVASEAEPVVEQIAKPVLDVSSEMLDEGEPILLKFRLKPAELGTVEIRLEKNSAGKLDIEIQTDSELAKNVLNESFEQLRESLKDSGWQVEEINIFSKPSSNQTLSQQQRGMDGDKTSEGADRNRTDSNDTTQDSDKSADPVDVAPERLVSIRA